MHSKITLKNAISVAVMLRNTTAGLSACKVNCVVSFSVWYVSHTIFALFTYYSWYMWLLHLVEKEEKK